MTDEDLYRRLGQQLRARRRLLDLTQGDVARACGTGFQQIQKYESGAPLGVSRLLKIAAALQVSPADLLRSLDPSPTSAEAREVSAPTP